MLNKIIFKVIKSVVLFLKKINLKKFLFDKLIFNIGLNQILENRKNYQSMNDIVEAELKIFSQNGEDGIIDYLIYKLKLNSLNFVELGVGDYRESNTRFLYNRYHPKGLIVDSIENLENKVKPYVNLWKGDLRICNKQITFDNINDILKQYSNFEIDIFSIDIDSIDYWIIKKIQKNISKIFIAEYNPVFGPTLEVTVPNIPGFNRTKYHYSNLCYGMSLKALINLMNKKNYSFVGTNLQKMNAFFVLNELNVDDIFGNLKIKNLNHYTDSNIRDSRDKKYKLNYLTGENKLKEIQDCEVINLENNNEELIKLKDLL